MSDYLNNLVTRTLGLAPGVRPRLASLFEPSSSVAADFSVNAPTRAEKIHEAETRIRPLSDLSLSVPLANSRTSKPETTQFDTVNASGAAETLESEAKELSRMLARSDEPPMFAPRSPTSVAARATTLEANPLRDLASKIAEPAVRLKNIRASAGESVVSESLTRSKQEATPVGGLLSTQPLSPAYRDLLETMAVRARAAQVLVASMQSKDVSSFPTQNASTAFPAPEVEPTISITIGRVDVRAVFPQPQAQRTRRVHPAPMSLDEYLKRRNEGRK
jgi:hypothetical protein